jgi:hypothetical protein
MGLEAFRKDQAMLKDHDSSAIVAVSDLERARAFYGGMLGLEPADEGAEQGVLVYRTGGTRLIVYRSLEAGGNRANAVVWAWGESWIRSSPRSKRRAPRSNIIPTSARSRATSTSPPECGWRG